MPWSREFKLDGSDDKAIEDFVERNILQPQSPTAREIIEKLVEAGDALVEFHNFPMEHQRPDVYQLRMRRFGSALATAQQWLKDNNHD